MRAEAEAETARQTTRFMLDLFKVSDPSEALGNSITAREILDKGAARIDRSSRTARNPGDADGHDGHRVYEPRPVRLGHAAGPQRLRVEQKLWGSSTRGGQSLNRLGEVLTLKSDYDEAEQPTAPGTGDPSQGHGKASAEVAETLGLLTQVLANKASTRRESR